MPSYPKVTSKEIKYPSPSGSVRIGKYIPPFEEVEEGFGYKGVVVEDSSSKGQLQCHTCGKWFENLSTHINATHKINCPDYKKKYGLLQSTALKSKRLRVRQSEVMFNLRMKHKKHRFKFKRNNIFAGNRKDKAKAMESQNKYGVCELQIMERIKELKDELGKTPTLVQLKARYGGIFITNLHNRYGSYVKLCRDSNWEVNFSNHNPKYSRKYFIDKVGDKKPSTRLFTLNESRALYKYFPKGINELKKAVKLK